ncbi:hypothetical protein [Vulcanococcus limneticus]
MAGGASVGVPVDGGWVGALVCGGCVIAGGASVGVPVDGGWVGAPV